MSPTRNFFNDGLWLRLGVSEAPLADSYMIERFFQAFNGGSAESLGGKINVFPTEVVGHTETLGFIAVASVKILDLIVPLRKSEDGVIPIVAPYFFYGHVIVHDREDAGLIFLHLYPIVFFLLGYGLTGEYLNFVA